MGKQSIGRYEVIRELPGQPASLLAHAPGSGTSLLRRLGAVPPDALERVLKEVALCAGLEHPAVGEGDAFADGGELIFAIPERDGVSLETLMERRAASGEPLAFSLVAHIAHALAGALSAAHSAAVDDDLVPVVHGALSPAWIWLTWDGRVVLDGLGLSAATDVPGVREASNYDAPERRRGGKPTSRGDIYSLGAVVWALLAGAAPDDAPTVDALPGAVPDAIRRVLERALDPVLAVRKVTAAEFELAFSETATEEGKQALAAALVRIRKGTNVIGTFRRPMSAPPGLGGPSLPRPPGQLPGAKPSLPRPAPPPSGQASGGPASAGAPLGTRLPPHRGPIGAPSARPDAGYDSEPPSEPPPSVDALPAARPSEQPAPPSVRPRLPSVSANRRITKSSYDIEDELSWGGSASNADIARAVDAVLLDDFVTPGVEASPKEAAAQLEPIAPTKPSPSSDPPPAAVESGGGEPRAADSLPPPAAAPSPPSPSAADVAAAPTKPQAPAAPTFKVVEEDPGSLPIWKAIVLSLLAAGVVFAGGVWWMMRKQHLPPAPPSDQVTTSSNESAAATASSTTAPSAAVLDAQASATAAASADAAPEVSASATSTAEADATASAEPSSTASAEASASSSAPEAVTAPPSVDVSTLQPNQAILIVNFPSAPDATVFHFATPLGKVGQPLTVSCEKPLFLRVAEGVQSGSPSKWLSAGSPRAVTCKTVNEVTVSSSP